MGQHNPQRLESALRILEDPTFLEVMAVGREQIIKEWRDAKRHDERERLHAKFDAWEDLPSMFAAIAGSEKIAEHAERRKGSLVTPSIL